MKRRRVWVIFSKNFWQLRQVKHDQLKISNTNNPSSSKAKTKLSEERECHQNFLGNHYDADSASADGDDASRCIAMYHVEIIIICIKMYHSDHPITHQQYNPKVEP